MTRKQRLMKNLHEIENELNRLADELKDLTEKKKAQARSAEEIELSEWVYNQYFNYAHDGVTYHDKVDGVCGKAFNTLRNVVDFVEMKDPVKVVYQLNSSREIQESYMEKAQFEKVKKFYIPCPACGAWVDRNSYKCSCDHHFREYERVIELTKPDGKIERYIRTEYGIGHEVVVDGVTYPAEWVLTPIERQDDTQNGRDTDG